MNKKRFSRNGNVLSGDPDPGPVDPPPPPPDEMLKKASFAKKGIGEKKGIGLGTSGRAVVASSMPEKKKFD